MCVFKSYALLAYINVFIMSKVLSVKISTGVICYADASCLAFPGKKKIL